MRISGLADGCEAVRSLGCTGDHGHAYQVCLKTDVDLLNTLVDDFDRGLKLLRDEWCQRRQGQRSIAKGCPEDAASSWVKGPFRGDEDDLHREPTLSTRTAYHTGLNKSSNPLLMGLKKPSDENLVSYRDQEVCSSRQNVVSRLLPYASAGSGGARTTNEEGS